MKRSAWPPASRGRWAKPCGVTVATPGTGRPGTPPNVRDSSSSIAAPPSFRSTRRRAWLDELPPEKAVPSDLGVDVPLWMMATVFRARAHANQPDFATARARVRTRRSIWLVCHGSVLRDRRGALSNIALMIEPAKAADVAPIVVQAYDLSDREQEITRL